MSFLTLQSLLVPLFKFKYCLKTVDGKPFLDGRPLVVALPTLLISLYLFDGLSGLTSGVLFLIVLPECTARIQSKLRVVLFILLVITLASPLTLLVVGAVYYEKELLQAPPEYLVMAKRVRQSQSLVLLSGCSELPLQTHPSLLSRGRAC